MSEQPNARVWTPLENVDTSEQWLLLADGFQKMGLRIRAAFDRKVWEYFVSRRVRLAIKLDGQWLQWEGPYGFLDDTGTLCLLGATDLRPFDDQSARLAADDISRLLENEPFLFDSLAATALKVGTNRILRITLSMSGSIFKPLVLKEEVPPPFYTNLKVGKHRMLRLVSEADRQVLVSQRMKRRGSGLTLREAVDFLRKNPKLLKYAVKQGQEKRERVKRTQTRRRQLEAYKEIAWGDDRKKRALRELLEPVAQVSRANSKFALDAFAFSPSSLPGRIRRDFEYLERLKGQVVLLNGPWEPDGKEHAGIKVAPIFELADNRCLPPGVANPQHLAQDIQRWKAIEKIGRDSGELAVSIAVTDEAVSDILNSPFLSAFDPGFWRKMMAMEALDFDESQRSELAQEYGVTSDEIDLLEAERRALVQQSRDSLGPGFSREATVMLSPSLVALFDRIKARQRHFLRAYHRGEAKGIRGDTDGCAHCGGPVYKIWRQGPMPKYCTAVECEDARRNESARQRAESRAWKRRRDLD